MDLLASTGATLVPESSQHPAVFRWGGGFILGEWFGDVNIWTNQFDHHCPWTGKVCERASDVLRLSLARSYVSVSRLSAKAGFPTCGINRLIRKWVVEQTQAKTFSEM